MFYYVNEGICPKEVIVQRHRCRDRVLVIEGNWHRGNCPMGYLSSRVTPLVYVVVPRVGVPGQLSLGIVRGSWLTISITQSVLESATSALQSAYSQVETRSILRKSVCWYVPLKVIEGGSIKLSN